MRDHDCAREGETQGAKEIPVPNIVAMDGSLRLKAFESMRVIALGGHF